MSSNRKALLHLTSLSLILSLLAACRGSSSSGGGGSGDSMPPLFAGASAAFALTDTTIEVSWTPATDNVDPTSVLIYNVYSSQVSGAQDLTTPDLTSAAGSTTEIVPGLLPDTNYFFIVRAMDTSGNEDTNLVEVFDTSFAFPDTTDPVSGGGTSAMATSPTEIEVTWNAATDNQAMQSQLVYNIYSATVSGGQNFLAPDFTTPPGVLTHTFTGLTPDTDHFYVVRAQDPSGNEETNLMEASDRTLVSFATQVQPIFTFNCVPCHGPPFPAQGQDLTDYTTITSTAIDVPANETILTSMLDRIEPLDSTLSYLIHKIDGTHLDPAVQGSGLQMPRLRPPLPQANRDLIRAWINQGAQNN